MPDRIEELFAELAESAGGQQQFQIDQQLQQMEAERELYDTPEARNALEIAGILGLVALPIPGSNTLAARLGLGKLASKVPGAEKLYGQVGQDFTKFIEPLKSKLSGVFGRSGSRVGTDVAGRVPLPTAKPPVTTIRGPRGPTNIGQPPAGPPRPAPPKGTRNTGGISDAERAQLPQTGGGITATKTARGDKEVLDKIMTSVRKDFAKLAKKEAAKDATRIEVAPGIRFTKKEWNDMLDRDAAEKLGLSLAKYRQKMNARSKLRRWKKGHEDKVRRGDAQYQEGWRSGYEPDIKGGGKMKDNSMKRIREIQAELDELYKKL